MKLEFGLVIRSILFRSSILTTIILVGLEAKPLLYCLSVSMQVLFLA